jgi:hypothetical protein
MGDAFTQSLQNVGSSLHNENGLLSEMANIAGSNSVQGISVGFILL